MLPRSASFFLIRGLFIDTPVNASANFAIVPSPLPTRFICVQSDTSATFVAIPTLSFFLNLASGPRSSGSGPHLFFSASARDKLNSQRLWGDLKHSEL